MRRREVLKAAGAGLAGLFWDVDATDALARADVGADRSVIGKLIGGQILRSRLHSDAPIRPDWVCLELSTPRLNLA